MSTWNDAQIAGKAFLLLIMAGREGAVGRSRGYHGES